MGGVEVCQGGRGGLRALRFARWGLAVSLARASASPRPLLSLTSSSACSWARRATRFASSTASRAAAARPASAARRAARSASFAAVAACSRFSREAEAARSEEVNMPRCVCVSACVEACVRARVRPLAGPYRNTKKKWEMGSQGGSHSLFLAAGRRAPPASLAACGHPITPPRRLHSCIQFACLVYRERGDAHHKNGGRTGRRTHSTARRRPTRRPTCRSRRRRPGGPGSGCARRPRPGRRGHGSDEPGG
jgi:hypothetical protein